MILLFGINEYFVRNFSFFSFLLELNLIYMNFFVDLINGGFFIL